MAHMIEFRNGKASMAWAGQTPWHSVGKKVPSDLTPDQMLEAADLNWTVEKKPAFVEIAGKQVYVGRDALVRSDDNKILDVVSDEWKPCQNQEAFEFFNDFVAAGDMQMETAGSLRDGQIVWALAKVNDSFELFGGKDRVDSYLLFTNPHRFGQSIDVRFTPIRVVCNNTLTLSLGQKAENVVKVSHRREFVADEVKSMLGVASEKLAKYKEMAVYLGSKRYTEESAVEYFQRVFPSLSPSKDRSKEVSRTAKVALELVDQQPGSEYGEGSFWQLLNAVTFATDHVLGRSADNRLTSAWYGPNKALKIRALDLAMEMAEAV